MILIYQSQSTLHYCADILECFVKLCIVNNGTAINLKEGYFVATIKVLLIFILFVALNPEDLTLQAI